MYEIKQVVGEDILIRYNNLKNETGRYIIELDTLYTDSADPAMMAAIADKLSLLDS